ncbi:MAG: TIGR03619 family F420-dependent LLM class oxidoreductase [Thaumarchaeota archaeon]|nr:TIGR03619 family F420-dependent LLM class oxidoreductase [Nitrososphaerota archaeon]
MKFGIRLPNSGPLATRNNILKVAEQAEALGFHSVWVHDHILWGSSQHKTHLSAGSAEALQVSQKPNFYESVTTLAYVAAKTASVKLGVAVLVLPLRNPLVLGKQLANLDVLSEGRLIVGVAPGAPNITMHEFEAVGADYEKRGKITDEYIAALKKVWTENLLSFSGTFVNFKEAQMFPKPVQENLKILIGGGERGISSRALRRVVELGDGWIPAYLTPPEIREGISKIKEELHSRKRDSGITVVHEMFTSIEAEGDRAEASAVKSLSTNFVSAEEGLKRSLVGSPAEIAKKLELYDDAGVDITELKFVYSEITALVKMMKLFSKEVLPSFS